MSWAATPELRMEWVSDSTIICRYTCIMTNTASTSMCFQYGRT